MNARQLCGLMAATLTLFGYSSGEGVKVEGMLKTRDGKPVVNASVKLAVAKISSVTDEDGAFGLYGTVSAKEAAKKLIKNKITFQGSQVLIQCHLASASGSIHIFRADGALLYSAKKILLKNGVSRIDLPSHIRASGMMLIRVTIDNDQYVLRTMAGMVKSTDVVSGSVAGCVSEEASFTARDTLVISSGTLKVIKIPLTSYQFKADLVMDSSKVVTVDTGVVTNADVITIAQAWKTRAEESIAATEKVFIDADLKRVTDIQNDSMRTRGAHELSSAAMVMMGKNQGYPQAIVYASQAVISAPEDALTLNNFGALLRDSDSLEASRKVLLYARTKAPWAPAVLTNLGNTFYELGDVEKAEKIFLEALQKNSNYGPAHKSLGVLYFARGDVLRAADHLIKSAEYAYTPSTGKLMTQAMSHGGGIQAPPNASSGYNSSGSQRPDMSSIPSVEQLTTPDFPNWSGIDALGASVKGLKAAEDATTGEALTIVSDMLTMKDKVMGLDDSSKARFAAISRLNERAANQLSYLIAYYDDRSDEIMKRYEDGMKPVDEALTKAIDQLDGIFESKKAEWEQSCNSQIPACVQSFAEFEQTWGRQTKIAYDEWFAKWKQLEREAYELDRILAEEFWLYSAQYMDQIYDGQGYFYQMQESLRRQTVCGMLGTHVSTWSMFGSTVVPAYKIAVAMANVEIPQFDPVPETKADIPEKESGPPCPFSKGQKLKVNVIAVSVAVDCESVELEGGEGIIAGGKYNFKTRETELSISAGLKAGLGGVETGTDFEVGAQSGITVTFDKNSQPTDIAFKTQVSATARVANQTLMGMSAESAIAVSGISMKYSADGSVFSGSQDL
ncbi:MAG TPA: tetratricopeptide repeat protein [Chitinispirillaceae bacterium]|nr:tetratricopeptide repeat protein [Chitinispirillaceae bacterium]